MNRWGISLASVLISACFASAQTSPLPALLPPPNEVPPPTPRQPDPTPAPMMESFSIPMDPLLHVFGNFFHDGRGVVITEAEYLLWFVKGEQSSMPVSATGILGQNGAAINGNLGDTNRNIGPISGGRITLGYWDTEPNPWIPQNSLRTFGVEARFLFVGNSSADFRNDTSPTLVRPFFDVNDRQNAGFVVASPGVASGEIDAHGHLNLWGAEVNVWKNVYYDKPGTTRAVDLMAGLRYLNANSELDINSTSTFNNTIAAASPFAGFAGNRLQVADSFATQNHFFGPQVGVGTKGWFLPNLTIEGSVRLALGGAWQDVTINGSQTRTFANGTTNTSVGGVLALPSNIGTSHDVKFAQIPEANLKGEWAINNQLTLSLGFSALYWNRVLRAADQIDQMVDITQIPNYPLAKGVASTGLGHPTVPFQQSDLWLLGISFGIEYKW